MTFAKTNGYLHLSIGLSNLNFFFSKLHIMPEVFHVIFKKEVNSDMQFFFQRGLFYYFLSKLTMLKT